MPCPLYSLFVSRGMRATRWRARDGGHSGRHGGFAGGHSRPPDGQERRRVSSWLSVGGRGPSQPGGEEGSGATGGRHAAQPQPPSDTGREATPATERMGCPSGDINDSSYVHAPAGARRRGPSKANNGAPDENKTTHLCKITTGGRPHRRLRVAHSSQRANGGQQQRRHCIHPGHATQRRPLPSKRTPLSPPLATLGPLSWTLYTGRHQRRHRPPAAPAWPRRRPARASAARAWPAAAPPGGTRPRGGIGTGTRPCRYPVGGA